MRRLWYDTPMGRRASKIVWALQLARVGLVFTAVSNSWLVVLLSRSLPGQIPADHPVMALPLWAVMLCTAVVSAGLYTFGMSLNDVMDARRDRTFAPDRPIPAGLIGMGAATAQAVTALLFAVAASVPLGAGSTLLCLLCAALILFYDGLGKHVPGLGILTLGLIRLLNMLIPNPWMLYCWPIWLTMSHVTTISAISHRLEGKRPILDGKQVWIVTGGWAFLSIAIIGWMSARDGLVIHAQPWLPLGAVIAVILFALWTPIMIGRAPSPRAAGGILMKNGLLWLMVYDAAWLAGAQLWWQAALIAALIPTAMLAMSLMRTLKALVAEPPKFQRDK